MRCIHIGSLCVQENVAARPTMNSIVLMLNSYSLTLPVPSQPSFSTHSGMDPEMPLLSEVSESDQSKSRSDKCWMGVAPGFVRRERVDIQVKGYTIPAGWAILTANSALHYNPNHQVAPTVWNVSITPNHQVAAIFAAAFYSLFNLFSGFFIPRPRIPKWWVWYYWICPVAWTVYGLIISQYGDLEDTIKVPGVVPDPTVKWYIEDHFGFDPNFMGPVAGVLVGFTVFFAFTYAYCIKTLNFQTR